MRRTSMLGIIPALLAMVAVTSQCNPVDAGADLDPSKRLDPVVRKALSTVSTVHAHQMVERAGARVVHHPGWSSRIEMVGAGGARKEIYRQTRPYKGAYPREVVLGFRDVALAVFDPNHRIRRISVKTLDGENWSFNEEGTRCPPICRPDEEESDTTETPSLAPTAAPLDPARLALAPAERARVSVSTAPEHRIAQVAGERATYHPGWSSRIGVVDAAGRSKEIYRQTRVHYGPYPREVALAFRDVSLAVFDPNHRIRGITVETLDGETWSLDEEASRCPTLCPEEEPEGDSGT